MINLIQADVYRMMHSKTVKLMLLLTCTLAIVLMLCTYFMANGTLGEAFFGVMFVTSDMTIMSLVGTLLAAHLIGGEFESRNIQHVVTSGVSRLAIVVTKMITYCTVCALIISPYFIASVIALYSDASFQAGVELAGIMTLVQNKELLTLSKGVLLLAVVALLYVAQLSTAVLLSFMFKKAALVMPIYYFISVSTGQISIYKEQIGEIVNVLKVTPFAPDYLMITAATSKATLVAASVTSVLYIVAITAITWLYFKKREIK